MEHLTNKYYHNIYVVTYLSRGVIIIYLFIFFIAKFNDNVHTSNGVNIVKAMHKIKGIGNLVICLDYENKAILCNYFKWLGDAI